MSGQLFCQALQPSFIILLCLCFLRIMDAVLSFPRRFLWFRCHLFMFWCGYCGTMICIAVATCILIHPLHNMSRRNHRISRPVAHRLTPILDTSTAVRTCITTRHIGSTPAYTWTVNTTRTTRVTAGKYPLQSDGGHCRSNITAAHARVGHHPLRSEGAAAIAPSAMRTPSHVGVHRLPPPHRAAPHPPRLPSSHPLFITNNSGDSRGIRSGCGRQARDSEARTALRSVRLQGGLYGRLSRRGGAYFKTSAGGRPSGGERGGGEGSE